MLLKICILSILLFLNGCNSKGSNSSTENQQSQSEINDIVKTCDGHANGYVEELKVYEKASVNPGEECSSAEIFRSCQNGIWTEWQGSSFQAQTCEVKTVTESDPITETEDFAYYLETCGNVSAIDECTKKQSMIFETLINGES
jgi:hypothetical protein